jgi:cell wall-associated NlpC family hydrolase
LQQFRSCTLPTASLTVFLLLACIPPPAMSVPSDPSPSHQQTATQPFVDGLGLVATALPVPQAALASVSLLDNITRQACQIAYHALIDPDAYMAAYYDELEESSASGEELVSTAQQYAGVRYRWAGMSSRGMDCSGLIARVLRSHGIRAPHNSAQLAQLGRPVHYEELQPGDLLFFRTSRRGISHVGMYVGNDEFIHASSGAGRVVTTSIHDPYYAKRLVAARRL